MLFAQLGDEALEVLAVLASLCTEDGTSGVSHDKVEDVLGQCFMRGRHWLRNSTGSAGGAVQRRQDAQDAVTQGVGPRATHAGSGEDRVDAGVGQCELAQEKPRGQ
jgi:hypothetical protein